MKNKLFIVTIMLVISIFPVSENTAQFQGTPCNQCQNQLNFNARNLEILHFGAVFGCTPITGGGGGGLVAVLGWLQAMYDASTSSGGVTNGQGVGYLAISAELFSIIDSYHHCVYSANYQFGVGLDLLSDTYCECLLRNDCGSCTY